MQVDWAVKVLGYCKRWLPQITCTELVDQKLGAAAGLVRLPGLGYEALQRAQQALHGATHYLTAGIYVRHIRYLAS